MRSPLITKKNSVKGNAMAKADDRDPSFLVKSELTITSVIMVNIVLKHMCAEGRELLKEAITCEKVQGYRKARDLYLEASDK